MTRLSLRELFLWMDRTHHQPGNKKQLQSQQANQTERLKHFRPSFLSSGEHPPASLPSEARFLATVLLSFFFSHTDGKCQLTNILHHYVLHSFHVGLDAPDLIYFRVGVEVNLLRKIHV